MPRRRLEASWIRLCFRTLRSKYNLSQKYRTGKRIESAILYYAILKLVEPDIAKLQIESGYLKQLIMSKRMKVESS